ncbi:MAG TPA: hypothetical protein VGL56_08700 [Fimbriimonadaceae bacterium]|jgi:uncharacterized protein (DUF433 family)
MWARLEKWQIKQLQRLANTDPDRVEALLNILWNQSPGLYSELAVSAIDQEMLSVEEGADRLSLTEHQVETELVDFRQKMTTVEAVVVHDDMRKAACIADGGVAVWEIIREYRKLGSVESLKASFPSLSEGELAGALRYAQSHPDEIESMISDFENVLARRRAEYPFSH